MWNKRVKVLRRVEFSTDFSGSLNGGQEATAAVSEEYDFLRKQHRRDLFEIMVSDAYRRSGYDAEVLKGLREELAEVIERYASALPF